MNRFRHRNVIVTGAARGIGLGIARRFMAENANVVVCDTSVEALAAAEECLKPHSRNVLALQVDVSRDADVQQLLEFTRQRFGPVSILVNNAGISPKHDGIKSPVEAMDVEEWQRVLDINLTGAFRCTKACLPDMVAGGWGRIVNIASQAGRTRSDIAGAHYAASKAGMMALARTVAGEAGAAGITVNSVAPGRIDTPMAQAAGAAVNAEYLKRIPVGRLGTVEDIAAAVAFLASDEAGFITGVTLDVNGGTFMV
jgi:3-oxoacyl-[acyl-carrier protein] reductase